MIIGLYGKMGTGKDYIAKNYLYPLYDNCVILAFADLLKIVVGIENNITDFSTKTESTRKALQDEGSRMRSIRKDYYIKAMEMTILFHKQRGITNFIITDVRYPNEKEWIENNNGVVIHIYAPKRNEARILAENSHSNRNHSSETAMDGEFIRYYIKNDPEDEISIAMNVAELYESLKEQKTFIFIDTLCENKIIDRYTHIEPSSLIKEILEKYPDITILYENEDKICDIRKAYFCGVLDKPKLFSNLENVSRSYPKSKLICVSENRIEEYIL